jgi:hypothetical protein
LRLPFAAPCSTQDSRPRPSFIKYYATGLCVFSIQGVAASTLFDLYQTVFQSKEPNPFHFEQWIDAIPNQGLVRYCGFLNMEGVLVTSPQAVAPDSPAEAVRL